MQHTGLKSLILLPTIAGIALSAAFADQEASNVPHVAAGVYGRCIAHSIPDDYYEPGGKTHIYTVGDELTLLNSFPWYAQQIYVACNISDGKGTVAPAVVRMGPWPRGHVPDDQTLAIAFHYDGKEVGRYSTFDIANRDPSNASCSVSHYTVVKGVEGFQKDQQGSSNTLFSLVTIDGRRLTFSVVTGELVDVQSGLQEESRGLCYGDNPQ